MFRQKRGAFALLLNQAMKSLSIYGVPGPNYDEGGRKRPSPSFMD